VEFVDYLPNAKPFKTDPATLSQSAKWQLCCRNNLPSFSNIIIFFNFFTKVYFYLWDYYKCARVFSAFHLHLPNCPFPSHAPSSLPLFFCLSFGSRKTGRFESSRSPLPCLMGVVKRRYWNQLNSTGRKYRFFCGPVWHLNRVICFGIIWLGEKGLRIVLSSDILGRDKSQKFVVLKDKDIGFISYTSCKLSFWWFVKEFAKIIWIGQPCFFVCRSLCNNWMS